MDVASLELRDADERASRSRRSDPLVYLIERRDRGAPKDELFDVIDRRL